MGGARPVLLKVSLFQLSGHGNPQNDAMFNFISDSSSSISGLSNEVYTIYVVQEVSEKMGKIRKPNIQGDTYFLSPLYHLKALEILLLVVPLESANSIGQKKIRPIENRFPMLK